MKQYEISKYIDDLREYLIDNKVFNSHEEMEYFFTMGGCYIFARILQRKFNLPIAISNNRQHCGLYLRIGIVKKMFFDITGPRTNSIYGFEKAKKSDVEYIQNHFGFMSYPSQTFEEDFINDILLSFENNKHPRTGTITCSHFKKQ